MTSSTDIVGIERKTRVHVVTARSRRSTGYFGAPLADSPWHRGDLARLLLWQSLGAIVVIIAWFFCSDSVKFRDQAIWTAVSVLACAIAAAGATSWLLTGLAAVSRERRQFRADLAVQFALVGAADRRSADVDTDFVTAAGMVRFHRRSCDVVRGKATRPVDAAENLKPCGMCQP